MPGGPAIKIEVADLDKWRKEVKQVEPLLLKELGKLYKTIGTMIVTAASARAQGLGGVAAKSAQALTATARSADVAIRINGDKFPWALGGEFGGGAPRSPQFKPWRGNGPDAGYFLYPTIRDDSSKILEEFGKAFDTVSKLAFPNR